MSKNTPNKGQQELKVLVATNPATEVVAAIKEELYALPEYAVLQKVAALNTDIESNIAEQSKVLSGETFDSLKANIRKLSDNLNVRVSKTKAAAMNGEIAEVRNAIFGIKRLADWLEERAIAKLQEDPNYIREIEELAKAVSAAKRVNELRSAKSALEMEAQSLLASIQS